MKPLEDGGIHGVSKRTQTWRCSRSLGWIEVCRWTFGALLQVALFQQCSCEIQGVQVVPGTWESRDPSPEVVWNRWSRVCVCSILFSLFLHGPSQLWEMIPWLDIHVFCMFLRHVGPSSADRLHRLHRVLCCRRWGADLPGGDRAWYVIM